MQAFLWTNREYKKIEIPDDCRVFCDSLDEIIPCAKCGRRVRYGDMHSSMTIHKAGYVHPGYAICAECRDKEHEQYKH